LIYGEIVKTAKNFKLYFLKGLYGQLDQNSQNWIFYRLYEPFFIGAWGGELFLILDIENHYQWGIGGNLGNRFCGLSILYEKKIFDVYFQNYST